eukprot:14398747-Heterocapsa_arctica.AAC.1
MLRFPGGMKGGAGSNRPEGRHCCCQQRCCGDQSGSGSRSGVLGVSRQSPPKIGRVPFSCPAKG